MITELYENEAILANQVSAIFWLDKSYPTLLIFAVGHFNYRLPICGLSRIFVNFCGKDFTNILTL